MMVYRTIIHLNIELQIPVIYRADFGLRGFTPFISLVRTTIALKSLWNIVVHYFDLFLLIIQNCIHCYVTDIEIRLELSQRLKKMYM